MTNTDLVTTTEAAEITGKTRWSLYRLIEAGELTPVMKTPAATGTYLFKREDVEALVKSDAAA